LGCSAPSGSMLCSSLRLHASILMPASPCQQWAGRE
jgi:hypothetical protein